MSIAARSGNYYSTSSEESTRALGSKGRVRRAVAADFGEASELQPTEEWAGVGREHGDELVRRLWICIYVQGGI